MSDTFDAQAFHDGLVAHGHIVPLGVPGTFARGAVFEDVLERFDRLIDRAGTDEAAERLSFPPVIDTIPASVQARACSREELVATPV